MGENYWPFMHKNYEDFDDGDWCDIERFAAEFGYYEDTEQEYLSHEWYREYTAGIGDNGDGIHLLPSGLPF